MTIQPSEPKTISGDVIQAVDDGKLKLYLFGRVFYDDVFRGHRHTYFAYEALPKAGTWRAYHTHNDAD